mmetsp:Transcript_49292/g.111845  ORF Transcript_49292/g.111845 Transcript_49292/m.111845 type:complete len:212 (+) Transcript_49292:722-1357(+)
MVMLPPRQKSEAHTTAPNASLDEVANGMSRLMAICKAVVMRYAFMKPILSMVLPQNMRPRPLDMAARPPMSERKPSLATTLAASLMPKRLYSPVKVSPGTKAKKPTHHSSANRFEVTASLNCAPAATSTCASAAAPAAGMGLTRSAPGSETIAYMVAILRSMGPHAVPPCAKAVPTLLKMKAAVPKPKRVIPLMSPLLSGNQVPPATMGAV